MRNPWTKKNPMLSMWLSAANAAAGPARSRVVAEGKRQASTLATQGVRQAVQFWTGALTGRPAAKPAARKRKSSKSGAADR